MLILVYGLQEGKIPVEISRNIKTEPKCYIESYGCRASVHYSNKPLFISLPGRFVIWYYASGIIINAFFYLKDIAREFFSQYEKKISTVSITIFRKLGKYLLILA